MNVEMIFFVIFGCVVVYFAFSIVRHGGFRGAMFGAKILSSVGEVKSSKKGIVSQKLKVHILDSDDPASPRVGIELTSSAPGSWSTTPITLAGADVRALISLLERAIDPSQRRI